MLEDTRTFLRKALGILLRMNRESSAISLLRRISISGMWVDVLMFHQKFKVGNPVRPAIPDEQVLNDRKLRIQEEYLELMHELEMCNLTGIVHESIDLIYVTLGTLITCGVNPTSAWEKIHEANMRKELDPETGRIFKPEGWKPAQINLEDTIDKGVVHDVGPEKNSSACPDLPTGFLQQPVDVPSDPR